MTSELNNKISGFITEWRWKNGISLQMIEEITGINYVRVHRLLSGQAKFNVDDLARLVECNILPSEWVCDFLKGKQIDQCFWEYKCDA